MSARLLAAAAAALLVAGCANRAPEGKVYSRTAPDVRAVLLDTALPFPLQGTQLAAVQARTMADGTIELALASEDGKPLLRYLATVTDLGDGKTRVAIASSTADASLEKGMAAHPEIAAVYLKTVREQVDAELEGRPFNNLAVGPEIGRAFLANAATITQRMQADADAFKRQDRDNIEKAYADEARGER